MAKTKETNGKATTTNRVAKELSKELTISAPNLQVVKLGIRGTAPLVMNRFSEKAKATMRSTQEEGSRSRKGKKREPKDFEQQYKDSLHVSQDGWYGIPAPAFRAAMVSACRVAGFAMTRAKLSVFVIADGFEEADGTPLVKIRKGKPRHVEHVVRLQGTTTDIRARGMFDPGWEAIVQIQYDADQFSELDVANLMMRVGMQVGLLEGRPDSKSSTGQGWGTFELA